MTSLPGSLESYLLETLLAERKHAFVQTDQGGKVTEVGGQLQWFGLEDLNSGDAIADRLEVFHELFVGELGAKQLFPRVELVPGRSTDLHYIATPDGPLLLFLDTTGDAERERHFQQRGNEASLVLRAWGIAMFEYEQDAFRSLGPQPPWMRALLTDDPESDELLERFPFLENFLVDAQAAWRGEAPRVRLSGSWAEVDRRGREWHLEASAARLQDGRKVLLIQSIGARHMERQRILQEARTRDLDLHRLRSEIEKKEVLLHCIIHDLRGPLSGMVGSMSLVHSRDLDEEHTRELLEMGLEQARYQEGLIRGILDAFSAEVRALESFESQPGAAPDLLEAVEFVLRGQRAAFEQADVRLELRDPAGGTSYEVVGERTRLERVLANLLENALRHSPKGSTVTVELAESDEGFRLAVRDQGPGVEPELAAGLFQKFTKGQHGGASGLGLYFCRRTVEIWGGAIGYAPGDEGGACFWIRLNKPLPA